MFEQSPTVIQHRPDQHRFELLTGSDDASSDGAPDAAGGASGGGSDPSRLIGWVDFADDGPVRTITSTVVKPEHRGLGHAHTLLTHVLDEALDQRRQIIPLCWAAAGEIRKNPDRYLSLVPETHRDAFNEGDQR